MNSIRGVTPAISSAVRAAAGGSLSSGHSFGFWTASAAGSSNFVHSRTIPVRRPGETRRIRTYGAYAGDLDGDGAPDLTLPNEDADDVRVMLGDGCGGFAAPVSYALSPGSVPSPIEGADLDGDGDLDIAVANTRGNSFSILLGDGSGGFGAKNDFITGTAPTSVASADFNSAAISSLPLPDRKR